MVAGYVGADAPSTFDPAVVNIADDNNTITPIGNGLVSLVPNDMNNTALIRVVDGVTVFGGTTSTNVSMLITISGVEYEYVCASPAAAPTPDCGSNTVTVDVAAKMVRLGAILEIDGELSW